MSEPYKIISRGQFLPVQAKVGVKSVKEYDYIVPVHLWNDRVLSAYTVLLVLKGNPANVYALL